MVNKRSREVLLVEPDKLLAATYRRAFKEVNLIAEWQPTAQEAINSIDRLRPRVIILEVQLYGHNGIEFIHELRSYPDWQTIPIILLTLVPEHELNIDEQVKKQLGIARYCYKPITSLQRLLETTKEIIGEQLL